MWTVIFTKDGKIEHKETFERYYHAQMLADNLILGADSHFGAANLPVFKNRESYNKNGIVIEVTNGENKQNDVERSKDMGYVAWIQSRSTKSRWDY